RCRTRALPHRGSVVLKRGHSWRHSPRPWLKGWGVLTWLPSKTAQGGLTGKLRPSHCLVFKDRRPLLEGIDKYTGSGLVCQPRFVGCPASRCWERAVPPAPPAGAGPATGEIIARALGVVKTSDAESWVLSSAC